MGKIILARIDERLVHGQVMTNLSKNININSIFIVDDETSKDEFLKTIFKSAGSRTGLKVKIFSIKKIIDFWKKQKFNNYNCLLLVKTIETIKKILKNNIKIDVLNVAGIAKKKNTTYIIKSVGINIKQYNELLEINKNYGVKIFFQTVPTTQKINLKEAKKFFK